jgi:hypothetical protein
MYQFSQPQSLIIIVIRLAVNDLVTNNFGSATIDRDACITVYTDQTPGDVLKEEMKLVSLAATSTSSSSTSTGVQQQKQQKGQQQRPKKMVVIVRAKTRIIPIFSLYSRITLESL